MLRLFIFNMSGLGPPLRDLLFSLFPLLFFLVVFCFICFLFPSYFGLFGCFWYPFYYDTIFFYSLYMGRGGLVALGTAIFLVYLKPVFSHLKWNIEILYSSPLYMIVIVYIMYIYVKKPLPMKNYFTIFS